ncbi:MAG: hypothetical protein ABIT38_20745 [Gemmatimonadaceae bacterium]
MNPSGAQQTLGNICAGIATLLYAVPLQILLYEMARKREDGGGAIAGLLILVPMWLLLVVALMSVTAAGGFSWLRLNRGVLQLLVVLATLAMAVVSFFLRFEQPRHPSFLDRMIGTLPIHLFPLLSIALVVLSLNPRLVTSIPLQLVNVPWTLIAALNLAGCGAFAGYKLLAAGASQVAGITHTFGRSSELQREHLASIPTLDPQRDFTELVRLTSEYEGRAVRDAALAQLRRSPEFVDSLVAALTNASPSSGEADHALVAVEFATFTLEEQKLLALPARSAMGRITNYIRSELRYFTKDRRAGTRREGSRVFKAVAAKLAATGVDFQPAINAFEQTFDKPSADDR